MYIRDNIIEFLKHDTGTKYKFLIMMVRLAAKFVETREANSKIFKAAPEKEGKT